LALGRILIERLGIARTSLVSLVGGGGKSTLMRSLVDDATELGWTCAAGTTTKVYAAQSVGFAVFLHRRAEGDKLIGMEPHDVDEWFAANRPDLLVVEADGSRSRRVKAPAAHEPPIPSASTHVIAVIGADAINRVIEDVAHRPMLTAAVCGCGPYERLTPQRAATLLSHPDRGSRKNVPDAAAFAVAITRIGPRQLEAARELSMLLADAGVVAVELPVLR